MVKIIVIALLLFVAMMIGGCSFFSELQPPIEQSSIIQSITERSELEPLPLEESDLVKVMDVNAGWTETIEQNIFLQEGIRYLGCNENGYFFQEDMRVAKESEMGNYRYGFQYWSGEVEILLEPLNCYFSTHRMCGDILIVAVSMQGEEANTSSVKIFRLKEAQTADVILEQTKSVLPSLYDNGDELIAITRDLDQETQSTISKILVYNLVTDEVEVIAEAEMSAYKNGERFMCAGGNDEDIYYVINRVGGDEIVRYSREKGEIVSRCQMEYYVDFITGVGDMVIISETDEQTYLEKAGYIGILSENNFEKICEIPLVDAARKIREARVVGGNIYFATASSAYYLEENEGVLKLYTYGWEDDINGSQVNIIDVKEDGIQFGVDGRGGSNIFIP